MDIRRYIFKYENGQHFSVDAQCVRSATERANELHTTQDKLLRGYPKLTEILIHNERRKADKLATVRVERRQNEQTKRVLCCAD